MNTDMIIRLQSIVHTGSLVILGIVLVIMLAGVLKPQLFRLLLREFSERKYIVSTGVFAVLLCGTVFTATQPKIDNTLISENNKDSANTVGSLNSPDIQLSEPIKVEDVTVTEPVAYPKEQRDDAAAPAGQTKLLQAGKDGQAHKVYSVTSYSGKETSRTLKSEAVTLQPVPEITAIGTKNAAQNKNDAKQKVKTDKVKGFNWPSF